MKNDLDLNTPLGLALQLNALQMLEDGGNTCGMHPRAIRRNMIERLIDKLTEPQAVGVDLASGDDKCIIRVARCGPNGVTIERTMELAGKEREEFEQARSKGGKELAAWAERMEEMLFGGDEQMATPSPTLAPQAPVAQPGQTTWADGSTDRLYVSSRSAAGVQHAAAALKMFGPKSDLSKIDEVEFVSYGDHRFDISLTVDGQVRKEVVMATPDETLDGTIGYMVGAISQKYGNAYGDALHRKLRAWKATREAVRSAAGTAGTAKS